MQAGLDLDEERPQAIPQVRLFPKPPPD